MRHNRRRSSLYGPLFASTLIVLLLCPVTFAQKTQLNLIAGARWNDGTPFGTFGLLWKRYEHVAVFATVDPGKPRVAYTLRAAYLFPITTRFTLTALCGPTVEGIPIDTSQASAEYYLLTSTGLALSYSPSSTWSLWIAYDYLVDPNYISPHKYAFGLTARLGT